jgi:hypothetical protein
MIAFRVGAGISRRNEHIWPTTTAKSPRHPAISRSKVYWRPVRFAEKLSGRCHHDATPTLILRGCGFAPDAVVPNLAFDNVFSRAALTFRSYNYEDMNRMLRVLCCIVVALPMLAPAQAQSENVPVIQGGAGPCSTELTVTGVDGKPVYAATVKVHIKYGFGGMRRLDLEAGTNSDGKVKFAGLPDRVQRPPLEFHASKDELEGVASVDPSSECQAKREIALEKPKAQDGH